MRTKFWRSILMSGLSMTAKLRHITDPDFWNDIKTNIKTDGGMLTAAIRNG